MKRKLRLDAIDPHTYGLRAAAAYDSLIDKLFASSIPDTIDLQEQIADPDFKDRVWSGWIHYLDTGDRDTAAQMIKGYQYLQANLFIGKHMHALAIIDKFRIAELLQRKEKARRAHDKLYACKTPLIRYEGPTFRSMVEVLRDTCMPSHAPTAAATSTLQAA